MDVFLNLGTYYELIINMEQTLANGEIWKVSYENMSHCSTGGYTLPQNSPLGS